MNTKTKRIAGFPLPLITLLCAFVVIAFALPAHALDDKQETAQLVEKAHFTMKDFMDDASMDAFRDLLPRAKGVLIIPQLLKGAFVVGASGGSGVLLVRDENRGQWNGPAFYTLGGASIGFQIGGQASEVILLAMTDRGVNSFLGSSFKLGVDAGVAAGPVGIGASAATANLSADILSFARSKGLYGGISLDGAVVAVRDGLNEAYYAKAVSPTDIFIRNIVSNPQAYRLIETVRQSACLDRTARGC